MDAVRRSGSVYLVHRFYCFLYRVFVTRYARSIEDGVIRCFYVGICSHGGVFVHLFDTSHLTNRPNEAPN